MSRRDDPKASQWCARSRDRAVTNIMRMRIREDSENMGVSIYLDPIFVGSFVKRFCDACESWKSVLSRRRSSELVSTFVRLVSGKGLRCS